MVNSVENVPLYFYFFFFLNYFFLLLTVFQGIKYIYETKYIHF